MLAVVVVVAVGEVSNVSSWSAATFSRGTVLLGDVEDIGGGVNVDVSCSFGTDSLAVGTSC